MEQHQTECIRCGSCCQNGGPALHQEDLELFKDGKLLLENCITIRKNEMVKMPSSDNPEQTNQELIKIKGRGSEWNCLFFKPSDNSCTIYNDRPLECRIFKCWEPSELQSTIGQNSLSRKDLLAPDDPAVEFIEQLEKDCPVERIHALEPLLSDEKTRPAALKELELLANKDLQIRMTAIKQLSLSQDLELFLLGRPFFLLLVPYGVKTCETNTGISLSCE